MTKKSAQLLLLKVLQAPESLLGVVIALVFFLPSLCGFQTWSGGPSSLNIVRFMHAHDMTTFLTGNRPIREFVWHELSQGRLPLWLPTQLLGMPLIEQYEFQLLDPLEWLTWIGSDIWWSILLCIYLFVGGVGISQLAKRLGVAKWPAISGAITYSCAGVTPAFYLVPSWLSVIPILPWAMLGVLGLVVGERRMPSFIVLVVSSSLLLLSGQPQIALCATYFIGSLTLLLVAMQCGTANARVAFTGLTLAAVAGLLSLLISLPQTLPFAHYVLSGMASTGHSFDRVGWHVSAVNMLNPILPFSMGVSPYDVWTYDRSIWQAPAEDFPIGFYLTGSFLMFAGILSSIRSRHHKSVVLPFALTTLFCLLTIGLYGLLNAPVWPFHFINLARYAAPVLAALISVMISVGFEAATKRCRAEIVGGCVLIVLCMLYLFYFIRSGITPATQIHWKIIGHIALLNVVSLVLCGLMVVACLSKDRKGTVFLCLALLVADLTFQFRYGFEMAIDAVRLIPVLLAVGAVFVSSSMWVRRWVFCGCAAASIIAGWSILGATTVKISVPPAAPSLVGMSGLRGVSSLDRLQPNYGATSGIMTFSGRSAIQSQKLQDFMFGATSGSSQLWAGAPYNIRDHRGISDAITGLSPEGTSSPAEMAMTWAGYCYNRTRFNAVGVEILTGKAEGTLERISTYPGCESGLERMASGDAKVVAFRDLHASPRAYLTISCLAADASSALPAVRDHIAALSSQPVVEGLPAGAECRKTSPAAPIPLRSVDVDPRHVDIDLGSHPAGLVVLNDQFYPGWVARVDGSRQPIYQVNTIVRGVLVPAEAQRIRFAYEPALRGPLIGSLAGMVLTALMAFLLRERRRPLTRY